MKPVVSRVLRLGLTGLIVVMLDHLPFRTETHSISTRDFPNIAADPHAAPRDTVADR